MTQELHAIHSIGTHSKVHVRFVLLLKLMGPVRDLNQLSYVLLTIYTSGTPNLVVPRPTTLQPGES